MNFEGIKQAVEKSALACGADGFEIKISKSVSAGAEALKDEISTVSYSNSGSITVRCVKEGKSGYAASENVSPETAEQLVIRACANALVVDDKDEVPLFAGSDHYEKVEEKEVHMPSAEELKEHTLQLQKQLYVCSDKVVDGSQSFTSAAEVESAFMNSAGLMLTYKAALVAHGAIAAVKDGEESAESFEIALVEGDTCEELSRRVVDSALNKLGAEPVESGKYNIIIQDKTMSSLLAVYESVFSARSAFLKTTLLAGKEGQEIASNVVTLVDDPFHPGKSLHCPFDAEGVAVYKKNVIEKGVLKTLLYNRMYASKFGKETTGNAASAKGIEAKGLYLAPGQLAKDELLAKLGNGIYITNLKGMHAGVDVQSGAFSLEAEGFLVEDGKKTKPVKNFTIADNFFTVLKKIEALSDRVVFPTQSSYGAPDVLITDINASGK